MLRVIVGAGQGHPAILAKQVSTLDVLSGDRAWLGIGAGWNEEESRGLGIALPPLAERFEWLEEAVQICLQMWSGDESPYHGRRDAGLSFGTESRRSSGDQRHYPGMTVVGCWYDY